MKPVKVESAGSREKLLACRACFATGVNLFSIHEDGLEEQFLEILGTVVSPSDGLPQHVCAWCRRLVRKFEEFWARSRRSQELLQTLKEQNTITTNTISGIDRVSHKLALRLAAQTNSTIIEYQHQDPIKYEIEITPCDEPNEVDEVIVKCEDLDNVDAEEIDYNKAQKRSNRKKKVQKEVKKAENPKASVTHPMEAASVKREPQWDSDDADYELDEEQELGPVVLKEELELGPVVLQPPDAVYAFQALQKKEQPDCRTQAAPRRTCSVALEPMLVDMELCVCKIGQQLYEFRSCPENDVSQSDEEFNASKKFGSAGRLRNKELKKGQAKTNKPKVLLLKKNKKRKRKIIPNLDKSPFKCNQYSYKSSSRNYSKVHLRTHTGEKPYKCNHCSSMFSQRSYLLDHLRTHTGEKPYKCNHCSSMFSQRGHLLDHLRTHTGEKPYKCNHCNSMFSQRSYLLDHLRTHTGEKPYKCNHCSSMFSQRGHLLDHLRTHTGEKPFKCNHCSSMFTRRSNLLGHLITHNGEKPFKCNDCSSMFAHKSNLLDHLRTHTGEKPFECNHCSSTFTRKSSLVRHLKTHYGVKPVATTVKSSRTQYKSTTTRLNRT